MIIGTAGHIDHGKTTLVRALTGVDTDRLPEEKKRGISIELGYAFLDSPNGDRIGFIDVPGHERLVHTMLAGATGIDHALLLVAADDGVMPQTREHLAVLSLLGIESATVVLTKIDRCDRARLDEVSDAIGELIEASPLAGSPVVPICAHDGRGLEALRTRLFDLQASWRRADQAGRGFRLAIDRVFTVEGTGTVVTGTLHSASVVVGDELALAPADGPARSLIRVRSLHAQNRQVERAHAGERCALGLAGVSKDEIRRGQWLVAPTLALSTQRIDTRLRLWSAETQALRAGSIVHVHLGAGSTQGSVAMLDPGEHLAPGKSARMQIILHKPIAAWHGDRVVLRDASASRTLAGGTVLDPFAPSRYRRTPQRLAELDALEHATPTERREALLAAAPFGIDLARFHAAQGLVDRASPLEHSSPEAPLIGRDGRLTLALHQHHAEAARARVLDALSGFHAEHPDEPGPAPSRLRRLSLPRLAEPLWRALLESMQHSGQVVLRGSFVHLPEHSARLSAVEERIAQKIMPALLAAGFEGAWARDLARDAKESEPLMRVTIARLAQRGEVHQIVRDLVYAPQTVRQLAVIARQIAGDHGGIITAAGFRDATALGRKRAIQILEYFDRVGLLRRVADEHRLRSDSTLFLD